MGTNQNPWPAQEMKTSQNPTPNPSTEGNQLDVSQPGNSHFSNFSRENTLYKNVTQSSGLLSLSTVLVTVGAPAQAW